MGIDNITELGLTYSGRRGEKINQIRLLEKSLSDCKIEMIGHEVKSVGLTFEQKEELLATKSEKIIAMLGDKDTYVENALKEIARLTKEIEDEQHKIIDKVKEFKYADEIKRMEKIKNRELEAKKSYANSLNGEAKEKQIGKIKLEFKEDSLKITDSNGKGIIVGEHYIGNVVEIKDGELNEILKNKDEAKSDVNSIRQGVLSLIYEEQAKLIADTEKKVAEMIEDAFEVRAKRIMDSVEKRENTERFNEIRNLIEKTNKHKHSLGIMQLMVICENNKGYIILKDDDNVIRVEFNKKTLNDISKCFEIAYKSWDNLNEEEKVVVVNAIIERDGRVDFIDGLLHKSITKHVEDIFNKDFQWLKDITKQNKVTVPVKICKDEVVEKDGVVTIPVEVNGKKVKDIIAVKINGRYILEKDLATSKNKGYEVGRVDSELLIRKLSKSTDRATPIEDDCICSECEKRTEPDRHVVTSLSSKKSIVFCQKCFEKYVETSKRDREYRQELEDRTIYHTCD